MLDYFFQQKLPYNENNICTDGFFIVQDFAYHWLERFAFDFEGSDFVDYKPAGIIFISIKKFILSPVENGFKKIVRTNFGKRGSAVRAVILE